MGLLRLSVIAAAAESVGQPPVSYHRKEHDAGPAVDLKPVIEFAPTGWVHP